LLPRDCDGQAASEDGPAKFVTLTGGAAKNRQSAADPIAFKNALLFIKLFPK